MRYLNCKLIKFWTLGQNWQLVQVIPILTKNAKFDPLRVEILNKSQYILDYQCKINRILCLNQFFDIFSKSYKGSITFWKSLSLKNTKSVLKKHFSLKLMFLRFLSNFWTGKLLITNFYSEKSHKIMRSIPCHDNELLPKIEPCVVIKSDWD